MDTQGRTASRNLIIEDIVARTGIGEAMIERLVRAFYGRARLDPFIGPIFEGQSPIGKVISYAYAPFGRPWR
jgi:hypothetical protein